jgi:8-oxo-dGTP pyrophosphatase MutT (NUDIX family)
MFIRVKISLAMKTSLSLEDIRAAFKRPLPGLEAQIKLAPEIRIKELRSPQPANARPAGVLILLYPHQGQWHFPLIHRTSNGHDRHSDQISLPGGSQEANESIQRTALREAEEEIGVTRDQINIAGTLSTIYIPPSNFLVTPTVGYVDRRPDFHSDTNEVAELIEVPLATLLDPGSIRREEWELRGMKVEVPFYQIGAHKVWGATAMILSEFSILLS